LLGWEAVATWIWLAFIAACAPAAGPTPTIVASASGSMPCFVMRYRVRKSVEDPTRVTPHFLPFASCTFLMGGRAHQENDSMFIPPQKAFRGWRWLMPSTISDIAELAISTEPPMTALPRSEPLWKATSLTSRPSSLKKPLSIARYTGA
jgi:hypothetical protein